MEQYPALMPEQLQRMVYAILTQKQRERLEQDLELDISYSLPGKASLPRERVLPARRRSAPRSG